MEILHIYDREIHSMQNSPQQQHYYFADILVFSDNLMYLCFQQVICISIDLTRDYSAVEKALKQVRLVIFYSYVNRGTCANLYLLTNVLYMC